MENAVDESPVEALVLSGRVGSDEGPLTQGSVDTGDAQSSQHEPATSGKRRSIRLVVDEAALTTLQIVDDIKDESSSSVVQPHLSSCESTASVDAPETIIPLSDALTKNEPEALGSARDHNEPIAINSARNIPELATSVHEEDPQVGGLVDSSRNAQENVEPSTEALSALELFLRDKIADGQCKTLLDLIKDDFCDLVLNKHLNPVQQRLYLPRMLDRLSMWFANHQANANDEVSLEVQSSICLLEQVFLSIGRASPLQDMYTAEEEELLDQLTSFSQNRQNSRRTLI